MSSILKRIVCTARVVTLVTMGVNHGGCYSSPEQKTVPDVAFICSGSRRAALFPLAVIHGAFQHRPHRFWSWSQRNCDDSVRIAGFFAREGWTAEGWIEPDWCDRQQTNKQTNQRSVNPKSILSPPKCAASRFFNPSGRWSPRHSSH